MSIVHKSDNFCPNCGLSEIVERYEKQQFAYGLGDQQAILSARLPVFICSNCEFAFSDERGEVVRHAAVCAHLRVLNPAEITEIRQNLTLSRQQFSELIGVGIASLQRWETGSQIQSKSIDNLLRLMRNRENLSLLAPAAVEMEVSLVHLEVSVLETRNCRTKMPDFSRLPNEIRLENVARKWKLRRS